MKIKIVKHSLGSTDGIQVREYKKDEVYEVPSLDMPKELANVFLSEGWAKEEGKKKDDKAKNEKPAPNENKAVTEAPETK